MSLSPSNPIAANAYPVAAAIVANRGTPTSPPGQLPKRPYRANRTKDEEH